MGVFTCTVCRCEYYDRRFLWESRQFRDSRAPEVELKFGDRLVEHEVPQNAEKIGFTWVKSPDNQRLAVQEVTEGSWAAKLGIRRDDEVVQANGSSVDAMGVDDMIQVMQARPLVLLLKVSGNSALDTRDDLRRYADALRATGTTANITGTALPMVAKMLGPVSAVGGICGTAGGVSQLSQGLSLPSGHKDQHLITKGAVTTTVGVTCTALGALATVFGSPMLMAALGLGVLGLGTCTTIDANMNGICLACRIAKHDLAKDSEVKMNRLKTAWKALTASIASRSSGGTGCWGPYQCLLNP
jgi:hypothetical protein